jgi:hypothetical protein
MICYIPLLCQVFIYLILAARMFFFEFSVFLFATNLFPLSNLMKMITYLLLIFLVYCGFEGDRANFPCALTTGYFVFIFRGQGKLTLFLKS